MNPTGQPFRSRDHAVDLVKGVACLLMVLAHVNFAHAPWLRQVTMASVLFFASTGMNLVTIVERRPGDEWRLAANAVFLIFAGFANNYVQGTLFMSDVFQSAGMAMLVMLLLRRALPRTWTWLFPLPFLIHWANQNVFYWRTTDSGIGAFFLAPGLFPLLPWLSFYLLGAHVKLSVAESGSAGGGDARGLRGRLAVRVEKLFNVMSIAVAALILVTLHAGLGSFRFDKYWMSTDYFLIGCALVALSYLAARWSVTRRPRPPLAEVRWWGVNSLVFYILHTFVIRALELVMSHGWVLFGCAVALTALLLRPALALQKWSATKNAWTVLAVGAASSAIVVSGELWLFHNYYLRTFGSFWLTFAFIACYPAWKNLTKHLRRTPRPNAAASIEIPSLA